MKLIDRLGTYVQDEEASAALEYGLCAALVATVNVSVTQDVGQVLNAIFADVLDKID